jgi:DNA-binding NarL/FixJ family response regulator
VTPRVRQYVAEEASAAGIDAGDIFTRSKRRPVAYARRRVAVRLRNDGFNHCQIARWMGLDPSTVHYYMEGSLPPVVRA